MAKEERPAESEKDEKPTAAEPSNDTGADPNTDTSTEPPAESGSDTTADSTPEAKPSSAIEASAEPGSDATVAIAAPSPESESDATAVDATADAEPPQKPKRKTALIVTIIVLAALISAYVGISLYFENRFWPNTTIGSVDVSQMTADEAAPLLDDQAGDYAIRIQGQGLDFTVKAHDIALSQDSRQIAQTAIDRQNGWLWPLEVFSYHNASDALDVSFNTTSLSAIVQSAVDKVNATATAPTNATLTYSADADSFQVSPEIAGTLLDVAAINQLAASAIGSIASSLEITTDQCVQPSVLSTDQQLAAQRDSANKLIGGRLSIQLDGNPTYELGADQIAQWVHASGTTASIDQEALAAWANDFEASFNTVGAARTYTRADGKVVMVSGGTFGWSTDSDGLANIVIDTVNNGMKNSVNLNVYQSADVYAGTSNIDWKAYVDVDLSEQYARYYDASGAMAWESAIVSGKPSTPTPTGVYMVNSKASPSTLVGEDYRTKVSYWMPFVGNAIGLHDANWQYSFGGSRYRMGYGSHGCVNLPVGAAGELYSMVSVGTAVIVHY